MAGGSGSGSGGSGGKGGGGEIFTPNPNTVGETHPQGLLSAIGIIERAYEDEKGGALVSSGRLTTPQRIEFMEIGGRSSFASGIVLALLSPLAIGVLEKYIPIFGSMQPDTFDKACGVLLALLFPLCYSFLFASAAVKHLGGYSKSMVNNLLGGMAMASAIKAILVFIAFHFVYFKVLSDRNIAWVIQKFYTLKMSYQTALAIFGWVKDFKHVFITSSYFVLISTAVFVSIPYIAMFWAGMRNKKLIEAGVANVFDEDN